MHQNSLSVSPIEELTQYLRKPQGGGVLARLPRNCSLGYYSGNQSPSLETGRNFWSSNTVGKAWQKAALEYYRACWKVPTISWALAEPALEWALHVLAPHTADQLGTNTQETPKEPPLSCHIILAFPTDED